MNTIDLAVKSWMDDKVIAQITGEVVKKEISEIVDMSYVKFSDDYYEYLLRSMQSLKFETWRIEDFQQAWSGYKTQMSEFLNTNDVPTMIKLRGNAFHGFSWLKHVENQIKEKFVDDWNKHLTPADRGVYSEFAFLVQALRGSDFCNPGRGQAIACSLFTDKLQKLYQGRNLGYVYNLKDKDIILASAFDAHSHFVQPERFSGNAYSGRSIGSAFGFAHVLREAFWSFDDFVSRCSPDEISEIVFNRTSWEGQIPSGIFIREGISESMRRLAHLASELRGIPIYQYKNGVLQII